MELYTLLYIQFVVDKVVYPFLCSKNKEREWNDIDVLKVAHHGSKHSTSQEFLDACRPDITLISAGKGNSYGHPHEELLMRLQKAG